MIDFPTSPAQGTTITAAGGITWEWNGTKWMMKNAGTDEVFIGPTDPGAVGDLWFNTTTDTLYALDAGVWTTVAPRRTVGYAELTSSLVGLTALTTVLSVTVAQVIGHRYLVSAYARVRTSGSVSTVVALISNAEVFSVAKGSLNNHPIYHHNGATLFAGSPQHVLTATSTGSDTFSLRVSRDLNISWGANTMDVFPLSFLLVEDVT